MSRRWVDPSLFTDEKLGKATIAERHLFTAMIANQDDDGRLLAHPGYLRSIAFPYDDFTNEEVKRMRDHLAEVNSNIIVYEHAGDEYIQLKRHYRYQRPRYYNPSKFPAPPGWPFEDEKSGRRTTQLPEGNQEVASQLPEGNQELASQLPEGNQEVASQLPEGNQELASQLPEGNQEVASQLPEGNQEVTSQYTEGRVGWGGVGKGRVNTPLRGDDFPSSFGEWEEKLNVQPDQSKKIGILVEAFRNLHSRAPPEDFEKVGVRLGRMSKGGNEGYVLKLIWQSASEDIKGSHLDYIQGMRSRSKARETPGKLPSDEELERSWKK